MNRLRIAIAALGLAAAASTAAHAGPGLNLSWDDCGASGVAARTFACDTDTGEDFVVGSVVPPSWPAATHATAVVHLRFATSAVPDWWSFNGCRKGSIAASSSTLGIHGCVPITESAPQLGPARLVPTRGGALVQIELYFAAETLNLPPGEEVFLFKLFFDRHNTIPPFTCAGCSDGIEIALVEFKCGRPGIGQPYSVTDTATRSVVTWNGGITPTRSTTWGQIKGIYR